MVVAVAEVEAAAFTSVSVGRSVERGGVLGVPHPASVAVTCADAGE